MAHPRFHVDAVPSGVVELPASEARHALRSRRLGIGGRVVLFDGRGHQAFAEVVGIGRESAEVRVEEAVFCPRPAPLLTLATAIPKGPRQDWLIEKCTELGVAAIQPLLAERSVVEPGAHKLDRWRRLSVEAAKQSQQSWLPELHAPRRLEEVPAGGAGGLLLCAAGDLAALAEAGHRGAGCMPALLSDLRSSGAITGFVGPEGGFTAEELRVLVESGVKAVTLGPHVLRIETAAVALAALVHALQAG